MSDPNDTTEVFGGEIWKQPNFPCFTSYIISGLPGKRFMARTSDPSESRYSIALPRRAPRLASIAY